MVVGQTERLLLQSTVWLFIIMHVLSGPRRLQLLADPFKVALQRKQRAGQPHLAGHVALNFHTRAAGLGVLLDGDVGWES